MGVGRYVTKSEWLNKWPDQPSYMKIIRAKPEMDRWMQRGKLWAEWTFRGQKLGVYEFSPDLNRSDWRLIHKDEEKKFLENSNQMGTYKVPSTFPLPPLQVLMAKRDSERNKLQWRSGMERAPLDLCIDPQFEIYRDRIQRAEPKKRSASVYDEVDPNTFLDWYGNALPTRVEAWNIGPASYKPYFAPKKVEGAQ
ncbi:Protein MRPS-34 [Aphelenchoides avenae]|nr:Protein MRPS-34 [Aphelenchus avenae]